MHTTDRTTGAVVFAAKETLTGVHDRPPMRIEEKSERPEARFAPETVTVETVFERTVDGVQSVIAAERDEGMRNNGQSGN